MSYIDTVNTDEASGTLKRIYSRVQKRTDYVASVLQVQSRNPDMLKGGLRLYQSVMFGDGPITKYLREALAVLVSRINGCVY